MNVIGSILRLLAGVVLVIFVMKGANGEDGGATVPPQAPYLQRMPKDSGWTIKCKYSRSASSPSVQLTNSSPLQGARRLESIEVRKSGDIRQEKSFWSDSSITEKWFVGQYLLMTMPGLSDVYIFHNNEGADMAVKNQFADFSVSDFPELAWLSSDTFRGVVKYKGAPSYQFSREIVIQYGEDCEKTIQNAWVDVATRRPQAFEQGRFDRVYSYEPVAPVPLVLPSAFQEAFDRYRSSLLDSSKKHKLK